MENLKKLLLSTMLMCVCSFAFAQTEVSGTIVDPGRGKHHRSHYSGKRYQQWYSVRP